MKINLSDSLREFLNTQGQIPANTINPPIFITGSMRSGTTYLVNKLSSHPQLIKIGSELNEVWSTIGNAPIKHRCEYRSGQDSTPEVIYQMTHYFTTFIEKSKSVKRHVMRLNDKIDDDLGRVFYDWDNIIPMNKSPHLMNKITYINSLFKDAKNIIIVRDIFGHSASMKIHFDNEFKKKGQIRVMEKDPRSCWTTIKKDDFNESIHKHYYPNDFKLIPKMWIRLNKLALTEIKQLEDSNSLVISYEELVLNKEFVFNQVFNFLNLENEHKSSEESIKRSSQKLINTTTTGNPMEKWKKQLSDSEKIQIEEVIKENQEDYNFIISHL